MVPRSADGGQTRYHALDPLRGLAALSVVFYHGLLLSPDFAKILSWQGRNVFQESESWVALLTLAPVRLMWAGREAVILFFVLSGFVLTISILRARGRSYPEFIVSRFFRLYVPYLVMVGLASVMILAIDPQPIPSLSSWFNTMWAEAPTPSVLAKHVMMVGYPSFNDVTWTLAVEWRVTLLFPLLVYVVSRSLGLAAVLGLAGILIHYVASNGFEFTSLSTLHYVSFFLMGIALAQNVTRAGNTALSTPAPTSYWIVAFVLMYARWVFPISGDLADVLNGFGALMLIYCVLCSPTANAILGVWPLRWLGTISYSLYLIHTPVLLALVHLYFGVLPMWVIVPLALVASLACAFVFYVFVENPCMSFGRELVRSGRVRGLVSRPWRSPAE